VPIIIRCPSCPRQLRVPDDLLGQEVKCPSCGVVFTASDSAEPAAPPPIPKAEEPRPVPPAENGDPDKVTERPDTAPPPRTSRVEDDEERRPRDDDEDEGRYRRRWSRNDDEDEYGDRPRRHRHGEGLESVRSRVSGPATALTVTGGIALGLSVLSLCGNVFLTALDGHNRGGRGPEDAFLGIFGAVIGVAWGGFVIAGARKMKNLESYGMAMAAAIVAMLPCNGCCLLGLPFGIWALVVLSDAEVKAAFR
jgi:predicted Zn finger-like uncharacterized protein